MWPSGIVCYQNRVRVLYLFCERFGLATFRKARPEAADDERQVAVENVVVCLVHCEADDGNDQVTKLIKGAKWIAGKFDSKRIVLHFFSHLSGDDGQSPAARELLGAARERLATAGYEALLMPYGYFCKLDLGVHGESLAKVFRVF
jgi:hypothetical protein